MNEQSFLLLSAFFKVAFLISLVFAGLVIRNELRRRRAAKLRRQQEEEEALHALIKPRR